jgi:hypothetical protein
MAGVVVTALVLLVGSNMIMSRTPWWFFQPWTGPLARQNLKLTCALKETSAGDIVLIGDSRVRHDFVASVMEEELERHGQPGLKVMNLGLDAAQVIAMREIADRVTSLPGPPRLVVIGVSAFTINDRNTRLRRDLRLYARPAIMVRGLVRCPDLSQKTGALEGLTRGMESLFQLVSIDRLQGACAVNRASRGSAYFYPLTPAAVARNRKATAYKTESAMRRAFDKEVNRYRHEYMKDFSTGGFAGEVFREMLVLIRDRGAGALVVNMPESIEFQGATEDIGRAEAEKYLKKICAEQGVPFHDLNRGPRRPGHEDFFDYAVHLKPGPAVELSRRITRQALRPGAFGSPGERKAQNTIE